MSPKEYLSRTQVKKIKPWIFTAAQRAAVARRKAIVNEPLRNRLKAIYGKAIALGFEKLEGHEAQIALHGLDLMPGNNFVHLPKMFFRVMLQKRVQQAIRKGEVRKEDLIGAEKFHELFTPGQSVALGNFEQKAEELYYTSLHGLPGAQNISERGIGYYRGNGELDLEWAHLNGKKPETRRKERIEKIADWKTRNSMWGGVFEHFTTGTNKSGKTMLKQTLSSVPEDQFNGLTQADMLGTLGGIRGRLAIMKMREKYFKQNLKHLDENARESFAQQIKAAVKRKTKDAWLKTAAAAMVPIIAVGAIGGAAAVKAKSALYQFRDGKPPASTPQFPGQKQPQGKTGQAQKPTINYKGYSPNYKYFGPLNQKQADSLYIGDYKLPETKYPPDFQEKLVRFLADKGIPPEALPEINMLYDITTKSHLYTTDPYFRKNYGTKLGAIDFNASVIIENIAHINSIRQEGKNAHVLQELDSKIKANPPDPSNKYNENFRLRSIKSTLEEAAQYDPKLIDFFVKRYKEQNLQFGKFSYENNLQFSAKF